MNFFERLEEELDIIEEALADELADLLEDSFSEEDSPEMLMEMLGIDRESAEVLLENLRKRVSAKGQVRRLRSREYRRRHAQRTTGLSRHQRRLRARRAARTRRRNPTSVRKAIRKRKRAMRRRKMMGIKSGH